MDSCVEALQDEMPVALFLFSEDFPGSMLQMPRITRDSTCKLLRMYLQLFAHLTSQTLDLYLFGPDRCVLDSSF